MSADRIGRLEALLKRVTSRAVEARPAAVAAPAIATSGAAVGPVAAGDDDDVMGSFPTRPPPPGVPAPPPFPPPQQDLEVELPEPAIELTAEPPAQSDERIVAAKPIAPPIEEELEEQLAVPPRVPVGVPAHEAPQIEVDTEMMSASDLEEEVEETAPSSSRRPLGPPPAEVLEQRAFGKEEAPEPTIHTPPPESGKLPAVPELPSIVESADYDNQDITGVHHTPPGERRASREDALAQSGEHRARLEPVVTRAETTASGPIADVIGAAMAFEPATFADLLDATLKL